MANIIRSPIWPDPRVKPPFGAVEIDWGHPLSSRLAYAVVMNEGGGGPRSLVSQKRGILNGGITWAPGEDGAALHGDGGTASYVETNELSDIVSDAGGSVVWRMKPTSAFNDGQTRIMWGFGSQLNNLTAQKFGDGNFYIGWNAGADYRVILAATAQNWPQNQWSSYQFTWGAGGSSFYQNGIVLGTNGTTPVPPGSTATMPLLGDSGAGGDFLGYFAYWYYYRRVLPQSEALWLSTEPYIMLRPIVRRRWSIPAAITINPTLLLQPIQST